MSTTDGVPAAVAGEDGQARRSCSTTGWREYDLDATAIQCWTSLQQNYGVNVCTLMSMMSEQLMPSACEVDVTGVVSMYALQLASGTPSALVDWNNNYGRRSGQVRAVPLRQLGQELLPRVSRWPTPNPGDDPGQREHLRRDRRPHARRAADLCPHHHRRPPRRASAPMWAKAHFTDDPLDTFGSRAVVEVPGLQKLMQLHLQERLRAPRGHDSDHTAAVLAEASRKLHGMGSVLPSVLS